MAKKKEIGSDLAAAKELLNEINEWEKRLPQLQKELEAAEVELGPLQATAKKLARAVLHDPAKQAELVEAQTDAAKQAAKVETLRAQIETIAEELGNARQKLVRHGKAAELAEKQAHFEALSELAEQRKALAAEIDASAARLVEQMQAFVRLSSAMANEAKAAGVANLADRFWNSRMYEIQAEILRDLILPGSGRVFSVSTDTRVADLNKNLATSLEAVRAQLEAEETIA